jgi:hypothetical protein
MVKYVRRVRSSHPPGGTQASSIDNTRTCYHPRRTTTGYPQRSTTSARTRRTLVLPIRSAADTVPPGVACQAGLATRWGPSSRNANRVRTAGSNPFGGPPITRSDKNPTKKNYLWDIYMQRSPGSKYAANSNFVKWTIFFPHFAPDQRPWAPPEDHSGSTRGPLGAHYGATRDPPGGYSKAVPGQPEGHPGATRTPPGGPLEGRSGATRGPPGGHSRATRGPLEGHS